MKKLLTLATLSLIGCTIDVPENLFTRRELRGPVTTVEQTPLPREGRVYVGYEVVTAQPDHLFLEEVGRLIATGFDGTVDGDPPPPAALNTVNGESFAVGPLFAFTPNHPNLDQQTFSGESKDALMASAIGGTPRFAIVYRSKNGLSDALPWLSGFPGGFSCARGVENEGAKDSYEYVACTEVSIHIDPGNVQNLDFVDWR